MITIMFEVEDLFVASRCGMVYMEPSSLGIKPLYVCWIKKLKEMLDVYMKIIQSMLNKIKNQKMKRKRKKKMKENTILEKES